MEFFPTTVKLVEELRQKAKQLRREGVGKHVDMLDRVAREAGYDHWHHVVQCLRETVDRSVDERWRAAMLEARPLFETAAAQLDVLIARERHGTPMSMEELRQANAPIRLAKDVFANAQRDILDLYVAMDGEDIRDALAQKQLAAKEQAVVRIQAWLNNLRATAEDEEERMGAEEAMRLIQGWAARNLPIEGPRH